jgi:ribosomal protein S18 acetylase RimI-like enzyme
MTTASLYSHKKPDHVRILDISRDLDQVANLIEMCFPIHLDQDGQTYIREMRKTAREFRLMGWLSTLSAMGSEQAPGFVYEESGQIIGNLSLIPFQQRERRFHMIANVAVHPDHRRRGIARALTKRALAYIRRTSEPWVWLQVRDDNPAAINLYHSVGFIEQVVRTNWRIRPVELQTGQVRAELKYCLRRRRRADWERQQQWLADAYPSSIRWNLPVDFHRFSPGPLQVISNFLDGNRFKHWSVESAGDCRGTITWQKTNSFANNLWLAFPEHINGDLLTKALHDVCKRLSGMHPLSINYPYGRFKPLFEALGFQHFRSLIWMRLKIR